jgi:hypothetical protein
MRARRRSAVVKRRRSAVVKEYLHLMVCCSRYKALFGVAQYLPDLFSRHTGKPLQEFINPGAIFGIFEQGSDWHPTMFE